MSGLEHWEDCYQKKDTPWDKGEPSPGLVDFLQGQDRLDLGSVCVPGCGMGHDALAWAAKGFQVTGVDLAPTAVEGARANGDEGGRRPRFRLRQVPHRADAVPL